jgi:hypothetical protein
MTIYWLLFGFAATMALAYPNRDEWIKVGLGHTLALTVFVVSYFLVAILRYQIGGDWLQYEAMYDEIRVGNLGDALRATDPAFGLLMWISARLDLGVYPVNGLCAGLIGYGVLRTAVSTREPWLAMIVALPYLLIVVGMGYLRQASAIGLILIAADSLGKGNRGRTIFYLALAAGFHSTASVVYPLFGYAMTERRKLLALFLGIIGVAAFIGVLAPRLTEFEAGYIAAEYDSGGAFTRLMMSLLPSLYILLRRRYFYANPRTRTIWLGIAMANIAAAVALILSPSSTAVDRMALYFSVIQLVMFGNFADLAGVRMPATMLMRVVVIGLAAAIQTVFLVFATHAFAWVPYQSVLQFL